VAVRRRLAAVLGTDFSQTLPVVVDPTMLALLLSPWSQIAAFVWGTLWGSFANVVIYRLPRGRSVVRPGSCCGACGSTIAWYDNIPIVSYLVLMGRCRKCEAKVTVRYLVVESIAGILSFALYMMCVITPLLSGGGIDGLLVWQLMFVFCLGLVIVTYTDLDVWIIPNEVVLPLGSIGLVVAYFSPDLLGVSLPDAAIAAFSGYALIYVMRLVYFRLRGVEGLGLGDGKLLFMIGAFQGMGGLTWALSAGAIQGLLVSVPLLMSGRNIANRELRDVHGDDPDLGEHDPDGGLGKAAVPFGPFLALAALEFTLVPKTIEALMYWVWLSALNISDWTYALIGLR